MVTEISSNTEVLHTRVEWDAEYGLQYTIQFRLRLVYTDDTQAVWTDWQDRATVTHHPPGSPASPYYDNYDYTKDPTTDAAWTEFALDTGGEGSPIEYRVVIESIGNKHRWFNTLPNNVGAEDNRGYGPFTATATYEDIFNQFVFTINKLYKARIELPLTLQYRETVTDGVDPLPPSDPSSCNDSSLPDCIYGSSGCTSSAAGKAVRVDDRLPAGNSCKTVRNTDWIDTDTDQAFCSSESSAIGQLVSFGGCFLPYLARNKSTTTWRIKPDQPSLNALPPQLRIHLDGQSFGLLGLETKTVQMTQMVYSPDLPGTTCGMNCCPIFYGDEIGRYEMITTQFDSSFCTLSSGSTLRAPALPSADFNLRMDNNAPVGCANTWCSRGGAFTTSCFIPAHNNVAGGNLFVIVYPK